MQTLVLGSTSKYRKNLLNRLGLAFECHRPLIDEEKFKDPTLSPEMLSIHLARIKAESLLPHFKNQNATIIGADQLVAIPDQKSSRVLGKPQDFERAKEQLLFLSGKYHNLITSVWICNKERASHFTQIVTVKMRLLSMDQIENYLHYDNPYDCAGSYKFESGGISLMESLICTDPTAIEGLPLIELTTHLKEFGYEPYKSLSQNNNKNYPA